MFNSQVELFTPKTYQGELLGYEYHTITGDIKGGPVIFSLKNNKEYLDLSQSILRIKAKLLNVDGTEIEAKVGNDVTEVALVNNAMHSMFSDVIIKLNDKRIEGAKGFYPYKAYIGTVFRLHENAIRNQTFAQGWAKDDYDKMEEVSNTGYVTRKAWTAQGKEKEFFGKLEADFFKQDRLLLPGVNLELILDRAKDSFCISCKNPTLKPKVEIKSAQLQIKIVKVNPEVMNHHIETLHREIPAIYPINRVEVDYIPLKKDDKELEYEELFHGCIPKYMLMTMVNKMAFYGDYTKNPYSLKHYNLSRITLKKDRELFPYEEFNPDFKNKQCLREYISLLESNGIFGKDETLPITYDEFLNGYTHFQWNLTANARGTNTQPAERGNMVLKLDFAEPLPEPVIIILYGVFDGNVYVHGNGVVQTDYDS